MSNGKKITFNMIASEIDGDSNKQTLTFNGIHNNYEIKISDRLGFSDAMRFVHDIVASCVDVNNGVFTPEGFDFAVRVNTLVYYAGLSNPDDIAKAYKVVYDDKLFYDVLNIINKPQFDALIKAAKEKIDFDKESILSAQSSRINELIAKMNDVMNDSNSIVETLSRDDFKKSMDDMLRIVETMRAENGEGVTGVDVQDNIVPFAPQE